MKPTGTLHRRVFREQHSDNASYQIASLAGVLILPVGLPTEQLYAAIHVTSAHGTQLTLSKGLRHPSPIESHGDGLDRFSTIDSILRHPCWSVALGKDDVVCWLHLRATEIPHEDPALAHYLAFGATAVQSSLVAEHEALIDLVDGWSPGPHPSCAATSTGRTVSQVMEQPFFLRDGERYGLATTFVPDAYREIQTLHAALNSLPEQWTSEQVALIERSAGNRWGMTGSIIANRRKDPVFDAFCRNRQVRLPLDRFVSRADLSAVAADGERAMTASMAMAA